MRSGQHRNCASNASASVRSIKQIRRESSKNDLILYGEKAEDIFNSLGLDEEHATKYKTVMDKFEDYFVIRKSAVFEKTRFNLAKAKNWINS